MWTICKGPVEFVTVLLLFYVSVFFFFFFGLEAYGTLAPRLGTEHVCPALEGEVLATGQQGEVPKSFIYSTQHR